MAEHEFNPYAAPSPSPSAFAGDGVSARTASGLSITAYMTKTWTTRTVTLTGDINAVLRYESGGFGERVFVNDIAAGRSDPWENHFPNCVTPTLSFTVPSPLGDLSARIDVYVSILRCLRLIKFRLTLDGTVLISEGFDEA